MHDDECVEEKNTRQNILHICIKKTKNERCITLLSIYSISFSFDNKTQNKNAYCLQTKRAICSKKKQELKQKEKSHKKRKTRSNQNEK